MTNIEIPYEKDRSWQYRLWEILPGAISWSVLIAPIVFSIFNPNLFAVFILAFLLIWFFKGIVMSMRSIQGYRMLSRQQALNWQLLVDDLEAGKLTHPHGKNPKWHIRNVGRLVEYPVFCKPNEYHGLNQHELCVLGAEAVYWDGSFDPRPSSGRRFSSMVS